MSEEKKQKLKEYQKKKTKNIEKQRKLLYILIKQKMK